MIVRYGSFSFNDNEAMVTYFGHRLLMDSRARSRKRISTMVIEGEIVAADAAAIDARVAAIQSAFVLSGQTAILLTSDGTATHIVLDNSVSQSGVKIVQPPSFLQRDGMAHFATGLPFRIVLEADYLLSSGDDLISYTETLVQIGDGSGRSVVLEIDSGAPIEQVVSTATPIVVLHSGEAVGMTQYPVPNPPLFPAAIRAPEDKQIAEQAPRNDNGLFSEYPVRWSYRYTLATPVGIPHPTKK